jgi:Family of unknown function (DUF6174)
MKGGAGLGPIGALLLRVALLAPAAGAQVVDPQAALDANRARWDAANVLDYQYRMQRGCFCPPDLTEPGIVKVRDGAIESVESPDGLSLLDPADYLTIDGLFDVIQDAIDASADAIQATYDETLGVPLSISIDYLLPAADDEISYSATELVVGTGFEAFQAELDANLALWLDAGIDDYDYVMQRSCFCSPEFTQPGRVRVRDGTIDSVADPDDRTPLDPAGYLTLLDLFGVVQQAIDAEADGLAVTYDATRGFPASVWVDFDELIADDEYEYTATEFVPEPASGPLQLAALAALAVLARRRGCGAGLARGRASRCRRARGASQGRSSRFGRLR